MNAFPNTREYVAAKTRLRDLIIATAPDDDRSELVTDFARRSLYDIWSLSASGNTQDPSIEILRSKIDEYVRM